MCISDGVVSVPAMCPMTGPTGRRRSLARLLGPLFMFARLDHCIRGGPGLPSRMWQAVGASRPCRWGS
jgi:hypothetical protein